jgi:Threonine dehydratase
MKRARNSFFKMKCCSFALPRIFHQAGVVARVGSFVQECSARLFLDLMFANKVERALDKIREIFPPTPLEFSRFLSQKHGA